MIAADLEANQPDLEGSVLPMCEFVGKWGGGDVPLFLLQLAVFSRTLLTCRRDIPSSLFRVLSELDFREGPNYVMAIVKASLRAPDNHVRDGNISKLFMGVDVATITTSNKTKCLEAQMMMEKARAFLDNIKLDDSIKEQLVSELEIRCVHLIHKKKSKDLHEYKSLAEIRNQFMIDVIAAQPIVKDIPPQLYPWPYQEKESGAAASSGMRQFGAGGLDAAELEKAGIKVGSMVEYRNPDDTQKGSTFEIIAIGETVSMRPPAPKAKPMPKQGRRTSKQQKKPVDDDEDVMTLTPAATLDQSKDWV